jgi:HAD superfamily hydrolase (TIGR01509 family)
MKAIIFDIGGVIQPLTWDKAAEMMGMSPQAYEKAFRNKRYREYKTGKTSFDGFAEAFFNESGLEMSEESKGRFQASIKEVWGLPDPDMISLLRSIRPQIKKAILSNSCPELEDRARSLIGPYSYIALFEPYVYFSHRIGAAKPDQLSVQTVLERLGARKEDCIFVDDMEKNMGLIPHFILFRDHLQLRESLREYLIE